MINTTQFDMQTDVIYQAKNSGYENTVDDYGSIKRINPNYIDKWYKQFNRYNSAESEPISTGFRILDCYSVAKENLKTGLRTENLTVSMQLAPVAGKIPDYTYLTVKLRAPGVELVHPYGIKKPASASFLSFCQLMTARMKNPFERFIELTAGNRTSGWKELRTHYPDLIAQTGIVSFAPTGFYKDLYQYTAYFFEPSKTEGQMPLSSNEFINGAHKEPQCDFITVQELLQEAFNVFAGISTPAVNNDAPPEVTPEQSGAIPSAPSAPQGIGAAPSFGSAQIANDNDEIPF